MPVLPKGSSAMSRSLKTTECLLITSLILSPLRRSRGETWANFSSLSSAESDLPEVSDDCWIVPIGQQSALISIAGAHKLKPHQAPIESAMTLASLIEHCDSDRGRAQALLAAWMDAKLIAIHHLGGDQ